MMMHEFTQPPYESTEGFDEWQAQSFSNEFQVKAFIGILKNETVGKTQLLDDLEVLALRGLRDKIERIENQAHENRAKFNQARISLSTRRDASGLEPLSTGAEGVKDHE